MTPLFLLLACAASSEADPASTEVSGGEGRVLVGAAGALAPEPVHAWAGTPPESCERDHAVVAGVRYPSLQAAVDAAESDAVITVCDGLFRETVRISRDLTLESEHGLGFSFLVGSGTDSLVVIEGASVVLRGLDLSSGGGAPWKDPKGGTLTVGGAIFAADAPLVRLESLRIHHNEAQRGGGIFAADVGRVELVDVELTANTASERGGGASLSGGEVVGERVLVRLSEAETGGGLALERAVASFSELVVEDCAAEREGGGLVLTESEVVLTDVTVVRSAADYGAAIDGRLGSLRIEGQSAFTDNDGGTSGGALFLHDVALELIGAQVADNQADHGGAAYLLGGAALLDGAVLDDNVAFRGGGLYVTDGAALTLAGGAQVTGNTAEAWAGGLAVFGEASLDVEVGVIGGNLAPYGAGILASEVVCTFGAGAEIRDNTATAGGGGLYANEAVFVGEGMQVTGNQAPLGAGVLLEIDAEYRGTGDLITGNTADQGAGLLLYEGGGARLEDVTVVGNHASDAGGGAMIHASSGGLSCLDCDWGTGAEDNGPEDIVNGDESYSAPASFACDASGCEAF